MPLLLGTPQILQVSIKCIVNLVANKPKPTSHLTTQTTVLNPACRTWHCGCRKPPVSGVAFSIAGCLDCLTFDVFRRESNCSEVGLTLLSQEALSSIPGQPESVSDFGVTNIGYSKHVDFGTRGLCEKPSSQQFANYILTYLLTYLHTYLHTNLHTYLLTYLLLTYLLHEEGFFLDKLTCFHLVKKFPALYGIR